ncbi:MAG: MBL fold metallo-hydrolase [Promethearchaeati archaeon]
MEWYFVIIILLGILCIIILLFYILLKLIFYVPSTGHITENIIAIKNYFASSFIFTKNSEKILIDAGFTKRKMKKELTKLNLKPENISHVFLTHSDIDHVGGLSLFEDKKIYFGKKTKIKNPEKYKFLDDGEVMKVGDIRIHAISTPGHRKGHTAYLVDEKFLFTGDLLRLKDGKVKAFIKIICHDFDDVNSSIKKIAKLENIEILLTAHTGYTTKFNQAIKKWKS